MGRTTEQLPDGCESKVELVTRYLAMNHGEKMSANRLAEVMLEKHGVAISASHVGKIKTEYYSSIGKSLPPVKRGRPPLHSPAAARITTASPASILQTFVHAVQACGGVTEAKKILNLLENGTL